jgi:hypothetical protein
MAPGTFENKDTYGKLCQFAAKTCGSFGGTVFVEVEW